MKLGLILLIGLIARVSFALHHGVEVLPNGVDYNSYLSTEHKWEEIEVLPDGVAYADLAFQIKKGQYSEFLTSGVRRSSCWRAPGHPLFLSLFIWNKELRL